MSRVNLEEFRIVPAKTEEEYREEEFMRRFNHSRIPKEYLKVIPQNIPNEAPYKQKLLGWIQKVVECRRENKKIPGLYLYGPIGFGKSSAAAILAKWCIENRITVKWAKFRDLFDVMLDKNPASEYAEDTLWEALQTTKFLFVDDVFQYADTNRGKLNCQALEHLLESRDEAGLPFVLTGNAAPEQLEKFNFTERSGGIIRKNCYTLKIDYLDYRNAMGDELLGEL